MNDPASRPGDTPDGRSGVVHVLGSGDGFVAKMRAAAVHDDTASAARNGEIIPVVFERSKRAAESAGTIARTSMTTAVKAIYENGVFRPKEPVHLQERTEVEVLIPTQSPSDDDPTGWAAARSLIGFIEDAPADMAEHHDHFLCGRPRKSAFKNA